MDERKIVILSSAGFFLGLIFLSIFSDMIELPDVSEKNEKWKEYKVTGEVVSVRQADKFAEITLKTDQFIDVMLFKEDNTTLREGQEVDLTGELDEDKMIAYKISIR